MRNLVAGNWKMNGLLASLDEIGRVNEGAGRHCEVVICPPATLIHSAVQLVRQGPVAIGAQDCHERGMGAHTGDLAAVQLKDAGAQWVILGHSERRRDHQETDGRICAKVAAAFAAGLKVIVCVGEDETEREGGKTLAVVGRQLRGSVPESAPADRLAIAYEPVWAIGSGKTPKLDEIAEVHGFLRRQVGAGPRLIYGGSVKPENAGEIFRIDGVDGGLIGGASLKSQDFLTIIKACPS